MNVSQSVRQSASILSDSESASILLVTQSQSQSQSQSDCQPVFSQSASILLVTQSQSASLPVFSEYSASLPVCCRPQLAPESKGSLLQNTQFELFLGLLALGLPPHHCSSHCFSHWVAIMQSYFTAGHNQLVYLPG